MLRCSAVRVVVEALGLQRCAWPSQLAHQLRQQQRGAAAAAEAAAPAAGQQRGFSSLRIPEEHNTIEDEINAINEKFAEAREEIEFAREDAETVYFNDSADEARRVVGEVLDRWAGLVGRLDADEAAKLQRSMGLKMEQLKAELKELNELHA